TEWHVDVEVFCAHERNMTCCAAATRSTPAHFPCQRAFDRSRELQLRDGGEALGSWQATAVTERVHIQAALGECCPDASLGAIRVYAGRAQCRRESNQCECVLDRRENVGASQDQAVGAFTLRLVDRPRHGRNGPMQLQG